MKNYKKIFCELKEIDSYQRVETSHPIAWYIGLDGNGRYSLFAITETQPQSVSSTKMIDVFVGSRRDGRYGITFSLNESKNIELFIHFCEDMISFTSKIKNYKTAADCICGRYIEWQKAFKKMDGKLLSFEQIKGLIGELYFLKMKMIPQYGFEKAVDSWSGIEATDQDFTCDDTWFEVKSTISGSPSVKISSIEQLDVNRVGHLVVVALDKTSDADTSKLTINNMVELVIESIPEKVLQERLLSRLLTYGYYYDKAYDRIGFKYNGMTMYHVDDKFPCLRKNQIPVSVQNAKYDLSLAAIDTFREE